jgi:S-adenosylmethionine-dependent methyltransferase
VAGRLAEARRLLVDPRGRWGPDDPLSRRMDVEEIRTLVEAGGRLAVERVQGHHVLADLVPDTVLETGGGPTEALAELEDIAAGTPPLRDMASRLHVLARRPA